jgi:hypothetical protein
MEEKTSNSQDPQSSVLWMLDSFFPYQTSSKDLPPFNTSQFFILSLKLSTSISILPFWTSFAFWETYIHKGRSENI